MNSFIVAHNYSTAVAIEAVLMRNNERANRSWRSRNGFSQTWQYCGGNAKQRRRSTATSGCD